MQLAPMKIDQANFNAKSASFLSQSLFRDQVATGNITLRVTEGSVPWESNSPLRKTCLQARCQRITGTRGNSLREKLLSFIPHPLLPPRPPTDHFLVFVYGASDQKTHTIKCAWESMSHFSRLTKIFTYLVNRVTIFNLLSFLYQ